MLQSLLSLTLLCGAISPALASGQLDPSFDQDGVLTLNLGPGVGSTDLMRAGLIDVSGRYVGVGSAGAMDGTGGAVLRILPSGLRDSGFGVNGLVRLPLIAPFGSIVWLDVAEQPDGKLVVAGKATNALGGANPGRAYVCRLLENGTPDADFDGDGCVQPVFAPESNIDNLVAIALQPDGRILLTGSTDQGNNGLPYEYVVARLDSDGGYDLCFGDPGCLTGGVLIEPEPEDAVDFAAFVTADIAIAPNGRIVVAGRANSATSNDMGVIRLLSTGAVDVGGFGNGGHRRVAFDQGGSDSDSATSVAVRSDGSIVLIGTVTTAFAQLAGIAALDVVGAPINGFGTSGKQLFFFNDVSPIHFPTSLVQQSDGKLLVVGYTDNDVNSGEQFADCGAARFLPDGQLDAAFATSGVANLDGSLGVEPVGPDGCFGIDSDGRRIVMFGQRKAAGATAFDTLLMRLDQDDLFGDGFEQP